jgi:hypothetical protein
VAVWGRQAPGQHAWMHPPTPGHTVGRALRVPTVCSAAAAGACCWRASTGGCPHWGSAGRGGARSGVRGCRRGSRGPQVGLAGLSSGPVTAACLGVLPLQQAGRAAAARAAARCGCPARTRRCCHQWLSGCSPGHRELMNLEASPSPAGHWPPGHRTALRQRHSLPPPSFTSLPPAPCAWLGTWRLAQQPEVELTRGKEQRRLRCSMQLHSMLHSQVTPLP